MSMELPLIRVSSCELRSVVRFFAACGETAAAIHKNLVFDSGYEISVREETKCMIYCERGDRKTR